MKKLIRVSCLVLCGMAAAPAMAQEQKDTSLELTDFRMPVSPAFGIMDLSPTSVERPTSPKALGLTMLNFTGSGGALPKNFALEISPYWMVRHKNETVFKYLGIRKTGRSPVTSGFLRKLTISAATWFNDSSKNYLPNTNYTGLGVRTNLLTWWGDARSKYMQEVLAVRNQERKLAEELFPMRVDDPDVFQQIVDSIRTARRTNETKISEILPLIVVDGAYARSTSFFENTWENRRFNRSAIWVNASVHPRVDKEANHYVFAVASFRYLRDNLLTDTLHAVFSRESAVDIGFRVGYERKDLAVSVEYVSRNYNGNAGHDSQRTVGIVQYRVSPSLSLFGTFGKNFGVKDNLFTMLGLNWGWGRQALAHNNEE